MRNNNFKIIMKNAFLILLTFYLPLISCNSIKIVDMPITFDQERSDLTLEYLEDHYDLKQEKPNIIPKMVVVHWTVIPTLEKSFDAFDPPKLPEWRPDIANASALNVSSQFLIDQDGTIYRLMEETIMARHVIGLNHCAIGIENVGGTGDKPLTKEQLKSNITLIRYLKKKYPDIEYLIGHFEYTNFEKHELWLEKDDGYRTKKTDPGIDFINTLRKETSNANWKPVPQKI